MFLLKAYCKTRTVLVCGKGQGLMEYGILLAVVAVGVIGIIIAFKDTLIDKFDTILKQLQGAE